MKKIWTVIIISIITILILTYLLPLKNKELVYISEPTIQIQCGNKLFSNSDIIDVIAGGEKINFTVEIINQNEFDFDLEYKVKQGSAIRGGKAIELTEVSSTKKSTTFEISPKSIGEAQIIFELNVGIVRILCVNETVRQNKLHITTLNMNIFIIIMKRHRML